MTTSSEEDRVPAFATGTKPVGEKHAVDAARLEAFLVAELEGFEPPLEVREFRGGQSNPTYLLASPSGTWVMRRKPPGKLLSSAHAVDREFRVISALNQIEYPVPRALLFCDDDAVIGSMFYVMEYVEGRIMVDSMLASETPRGRRATYESVLETLARLHCADPVALGLEGYGPPGNYFARQLSRWSKQYRASVSDAERLPEMVRLMDWLPKNIPVDDATTVVHGDYGPNNLLLHPTEPRVAAVLDWELSTLGHPLGDFTYQLALRHSPASEFRGVSDEELTRRGIPTQDEAVEIYCRHSGRANVEDLDFYLSYNFFRTAAILQGIAGRVREGTAAGEGVDKFIKMVRPLAELSMEFASRLGA